MRPLRYLNGGTLSPFPAEAQQRDQSRPTVLKTRKIEKFVKKHIQPHMPGFSVHKWLLYKEPAAPVLRGFALEDSAVDKEWLYLWVFVMPLYVPRKEVIFTFGQRLENRKSWLGLFTGMEVWTIAGEPDPAEVTSMLAAIRRSLPYLKGLDDPVLLARNLTWTTKLFGNPSVAEAVAYSLAKIGNYSKAKRKLHKLIRTGFDHPWHPIASNAERLLAAIERGPKDAQRLLTRWTQETITNIGLPISV